VSPQLISICALVAMFVVATILPINMGVLAFVGAYFVGTLVTGKSTKDIIAAFPGGLFLTLVGITYLFAIAQNNGTIDWLVRLAVRAVRGRIAAIPCIMFFIAAVLTAVGAVSPGAVAIIAVIALGFAARHGIRPLLMGLRSSTELKAVVSRRSVSTAASQTGLSSRLGFRSVVLLPSWAALASTWPLLSCSSLCSVAASSRSSGMKVLPQQMGRARSM